MVVTQQEFDECFWQRNLNHTALGTKVSGESITVEWFTSYPALAYYTLVCFLCMFVFIGTHFWKRSLMKQGHLDMSLFFWKLSILCYAFVAVTTGITRFAMALGAIHNAAELNCIINMALYWQKQFFEVKGKKYRKYMLVVFGLLYFCAEFMLAMTLPIKEGFTIIVIMGVFCDFTTFVLWTIVWLRGITHIWPFLAMLFHMIYIALFFMNCAIRPWGRVSGLGLNVFAMLFASFRSKVKQPPQQTQDKVPVEQSVSRESLGNSLNIMGSRVGLNESQTIQPMTVKDKNSDNESEDS